MVLVDFYVSCVVISSHLSSHNWSTAETRYTDRLLSWLDEHKARTVQIHNVKYKYILESEG